jgi:hypothetical protein
MRGRVERRSYPALRWLAGKPPWLPAVGLGAVLVLGLVLGGVVGGLLIGLIAAYAAWLGYLAWPAVTWRGRLVRVATVAALLAVAGTTGADA